MTFVVAFLLLGGLTVALLVIKPWADGVMETTITVSADGQPSVVVYQGQTLFRTSRQRRTVARVQVDLAPWAGRVIRFDVRGKLRPRKPQGNPIKGYLGCLAELVGAAGAHPIQFVGWDNDGSNGMKFHIGRLGCQSLVVAGPESPPFVYTADNSLWHALRVPQNARLQISLTPVMADRAGNPPKPFVPPIPPSQVLTAGWPQAPSGGRPDVFIFVIDALRADHLGCYGYPRGTSPAIDAFAAQATLYRHAYTTATWTRPSVAALLSGCYPSMHRTVSQAPDTRLPEWPVLLPEALQKAGYRTLFVSANRFISEPFGFNQGFDEFICESAYKSDIALLRCDWVNARAAELLTKQDPEQPVFMYLHIMETHLPYKAGPGAFRVFNRGYPGRYQPTWPAILDAGGWFEPDLTSDDIGYLIDWYDACVFEADRGFADFLGILRRTGRFHNSLIILLADHGEAFLEHETLDHGRTLNNEEMHVPLTIRFPEGRFSRTLVDQRVSLVDVFPTVLGVVGVDPPDTYPLPGSDLGLATQHSASPRPRPIFAELSRYGDSRLDLVQVTDEDGYKRVLDMSAVPGKLVSKKAVGLWDTRADPGEEVDLTLRLPIRAAYHEQLIAGWLANQRQWADSAAAGVPQPVEMTDEMREQMQALGYLD